MIPCTEFIPAYSELFKYLEEKEGIEAVKEFWEYLSGTFDTLEDLVKRKGLEGCWDYWSITLNEEAADFTMELDEREFKIIMHHCPSKGRLIAYDHIEPYRDYCKHCDLMYRRVLEPLGYKYSIDLSGCHKAKCSISIKNK